MSINEKEWLYCLSRGSIGNIFILRGRLKKLIFAIHIVVLLREGPQILKVSNKSIALSFSLKEA